LIPLSLREHFENVFSTDDQGIAVQHRPHAGDKAAGLAYAHAEQPFELAPVDKLGGYAAQFGADLGYAASPIR
jgi:hypothetical protein